MMTPTEFRNAMFTLQRTIGPKAQVFLSMSADEYADRKAQPLHISIYPFGLGSNNERMETGYFATFDELHADMLSTWSRYEIIHRQRLIKRMALAIIRIQDDQGECNTAALRIAGFEANEITTHGEAACAEANAIAGKGPFLIRAVAKSNGAPNHEIEENPPNH